MWDKEKQKMSIILNLRKLGVFLSIVSITSTTTCSYARDYSAGEGGASEIDSCAADAAKFCHDEIMWQHEMEECLQKHAGQISKTCRAQIQPFSFRKYYNEEPHLF